MTAKAMEMTAHPSTDPSPVATGEGNLSTISRSSSPPPPCGGGGKTAPRKRKGLKPRHIPQRTCIITRQTGDKRGHVRIVRTPEGRVEVDPTGKKNGRGAYLTADRAIWERALNGNALARALKCDIIPEDAAALMAYAEALPRTED
jgi:predicted RNA-binding protein YlxR (DUF448 family)